MATRNTTQASQSFTVNLRKLEEAVHFVCATCTAADLLGAVKLNKILYYSDMVAYAEMGSPITGATYVKQRRGPVPRQILTAIDNLRRAGRLETREVSVFDFMRREFTAVGETNLTLFNSVEIEIIARMIRVVCDHTAGEISEISHTIVWEAADMGEVLPYESFLVSYLGDITEEEIAQAVSIVMGIEQDHDERHKR